MVEISIVCLIYKSTELAEALYESVLKNTPMLSTGRAEFFFVANDPSEEVVDFLKAKRIPHIVNLNERLSNEELFSLGFAAPEYMRRVYQGYNFGISKAKGQKVVLINSDNFFSKDWLENLLKYSDYTKVVCSSLVEPGQERVGIFPYAIEKNFGRILGDFKEKEFQSFAEKISKTGYSSGGAYMPCLMYRDVAVLAGLYPEGNLAGKSFNEVSRFGDEYFYDRLAEFGIEHITAKDSIVYHLKEAEKSEIIKEVAPYKSKRNRQLKFNERLVVHPTELISYISPEVKHKGIIDELGSKLTVLILNPENEMEVEGHIMTINNFDFKNIETVLISNNKKIVKKFNRHIKTFHAEPNKTDKVLYDLFHTMFGEHLLVINKDCNYKKDLFKDISQRSFLYYFGGEERAGKLITDYMGHFLFPKKALVSQAPSFLGFLVEKGKIEVDFSNLDVINIPSVEEVEERPREDRPRRANIAAKVMRKVEKDGLRGLAGAVKRKVIK